MTKPADPVIQQLASIPEKMADSLNPSTPTEGALGGSITAGAGYLATQFGPSFGGLFLAFPAILVASTTLVEKHERKRLEEKGLKGQQRGRQAAGADSAGAAMGSVGLMAFAGFVWKFLPNHSAWLVLPFALVLWAGLAATIWWLWKRDFPRKLRALPARWLKGKS